LLPTTSTSGGAAKDAVLLLLALLSALRRTASGLATSPQRPQRASLQGDGNRARKLLPLLLLLLEGRVPPLAVPTKRKPGASQPAARKKSPSAGPVRSSRFARVSATYSRCT